MFFNWQKYCTAHGQQVRLIRSPEGDTHKAERFGDTITADYLFVDRHFEDAGVGVNINGLVMLDVATLYLDYGPSESQDTNTTEMNLRCFAGDVKVRRFYSDNDDVLIAAARNLKCKHEFSKPHDPQSNGLIESHVGIVKSGARALLYQAGMPAMCWPWAVKYCCRMKNIQDRYNTHGNVVASNDFPAVPEEF